MINLPIKADGATGPLIVAVGGTLRSASSSSAALLVCLRYAQSQGARVQIFTGDDLRMPLYDPHALEMTDSCARMIDALREADGILLASPGYHGSISGTLKNALDYTEAMRNDPLCYFDGRAVGCIASAAGWQASAATLSALRAIVHALRGWPTPLGVTLNSSEKLFDADGASVSSAVETNLCLLTQQVLDFACQRRSAIRRSTTEGK